MNGRRGSEDRNNFFFPFSECGCEEKDKAVVGFHELSGSGPSKFQPLQFFPLNVLPIFVAIEITRLKKKTTSASSLRKDWRFPHKALKALFQMCSSVFLVIQLFS